MTMAPALRKFALTAHIVSSIGWAGALAAFLVLAAAGLTSQNTPTVRVAYVASDLITWYAIVPLAIASLVTGIVQALATPWGLFQHFWVVIKLVIVAAATFMLLMKTGPIGYIADRAAEGALSPTDLMGLKISILAHAVGGLLVLLWAAALGMYKPRGLTRYGWRKARQSEREQLTG